MKTLRLTSLLLCLRALTACALPAAPQPPAAGNKPSQQVLLRYRWLHATELPQVLAWLRERGPFT